MDINREWEKAGHFVTNRKEPREATQPLKSAPAVCVVRSAVPIL